MSRPQTRELTYRRQHDQRNTQNFTAPALRPTIQPRGSSVAPELKLSNADRLATSLGALGQGAQQAQPFMEQYAQQKYEQGKLDAMMGKTETSGGYFAVRAFEKTKGEVTAHRDFKKTLQQYYMENRLDADPEQFQGGLEQISQEFMEGQTENFLEGFVPLAMGLETQMLDQYSKFIQEEQYKESLETLRQYGFEEVSTVLDTMVGQAFGDSLGIYSVDKLLKDNPNNYRLFFENADTKKQLNGVMRDVLTHMQESGKDMGITRHEVNEIFLDYLISESKVKGIPALLEVAFEPDESGISLMASEMSSAIDGTYATLLDNINRRIEQHGETEELMAEKETAEKEKALANQAFRNYWGDINQSSFAHPEDAIEFLNNLQQDIYENEHLVHLTNSDYTRLTDKVTNALEDAIEAEGELIDNAYKERQHMNERVVDNFIDNQYINFYDLLDQPLREYDEEGNLVATRASYLRGIKESILSGAQEGITYGAEGEHTAFMSSKDYKPLMTMIERSLQEATGELEVTSSTDTLMALEYNITLGNPYDQEDLVDMYNNGKLSSDDLITYTRRNAQALDDLQNDALKNHDRGYIDATIRNISSILVNRDDSSIFTTFKHLNPETLTNPEVDQYFTERIQAYKHSNEGRYPTASEFREMADDYIAQFPQLESLDDMMLGALLSDTADKQLNDFFERAETLPNYEEREIIEEYISDYEEAWFKDKPKRAKTEALSQFNFASVEEFREADMTGKEFLSKVQEGLDTFRADGGSDAGYTEHLFRSLDDNYSSEMAHFYKNYFVLERLAIPTIEEFGLVENRASTVREISEIQAELQGYLMSFGVPLGYTTIASNYLIRVLKEN